MTALGRRREPSPVRRRAGIWPRSCSGSPRWRCVFLFPVRYLILTEIAGSACSRSRSI